MSDKARLMANRRLIVRGFKRQQLTLQLDATVLLEETLAQHDIPAEDFNDTIDNIATSYVAREGLSIVTKARLETVLESMQKSTHYTNRRPTHNSLDPHLSQRPRSIPPLSQQQSRTQSSSQPSSFQTGRRASEQEDATFDLAYADQDPASQYQQRQSQSFSQDGMQVEDGYADYEQQEDEEEDDDVDVTELFHVIDAFDMPRWRWAQDVRLFVRQEVDTLNQYQEVHHGNNYPSSGSTSSNHPPQHGSSTNNNQKNKILPTAEAKTALYRGRYEVLLQRILRNETFAPPVFTGGYVDPDKYLKLTPLKALKGRCGEKFLMFGMLAQMSEGKYCLEDPDERIQLDLRDAQVTAGLFTENCFVLIDGVYTDDNLIEVHTIGLPPPELRDETRKVFGAVDFLGTSTTSGSSAPGRGSSRHKELRTEQQLNVICKEYKHISFVVLADLHLDQPKTLQTLRTILEGYASMDTFPLAFILMGNFKSEPYQYSGTESKSYRESWNNLADLIAEFPDMAKFCYFVFVPGPNDPWGGTAILPRPKVPDFFTRKVRQVCKRAVFTSNPCRIQYCDQELVFFRDDILNKLRRNCVVPPTVDVVVQKQLARTLIDGAHLSPLSLNIRPVYWGYDHALRLYPVPDLLVLADKFEQYECVYQKCLVMNPGSFPANDYSWMVYFPASQTSEVCSIPKP